MRSLVTLYHVLSLKQPWATLLSAGRKSIEIRRWQTSYRGLVLIHAARISDPRAEAWNQVPPDLLERTREVGGIVGVGMLSSIKVYDRADLFAAEKSSHLNDPSWFEPAGLYGLCFSELRPVPFYRMPGQVRLFRCELEDFVVPPASDAPQQRWQRILRSLFGPVRSAMANPEQR